MNINKIVRNIILLLCLMISYLMPAQNHTTIYGNVGVENVNIQVLNTQYGTSSDKNGDYKIDIHRDTLDIMLLYTCVGYEDAVVVLTPEQQQNDSLNISFKMRQKDQMLDAVEITATKLSNIVHPNMS